MLNQYTLPLEGINESLESYQTPFYLYDVIANAGFEDFNDCLFSGLFATFVPLEGAV